MTTSMLALLTLATIRGIRAYEADQFNDDGVFACVALFSLWLTASRCSYTVPSAYANDRV